MQQDPTQSSGAQLDDELLARLAIQALERTAFVLADPCDAPDSLPAADTFAEIDFRGPTDGSVELHASRAFARNLAASLLGVDASEVPDSQAEEALRELANIIGGSVMTALGGADCRFSLGLPRLRSAGATTPRAASHDTSCVLDAEGERLEIHCHRARAA